MAQTDSVRLSLVVSPELNEKLERLAAADHSTKSVILRKAIALFDLAAEAKADENRLAILDKNKQLLKEIVGI